MRGWLGSATWLGVVALATGAACAHSVISNERVCTPGNYVFCRCKDSSEGTKLCHADGMGFESCTACQASDEVPPTTDSLDAESPGGGDKDARARDGSADVLTAARPAPGELLITEVMYDPSGTEPDQEWIELFNAAAEPRLLSGLTLKDGGNRMEAIAADPPIVLAPGQYAVLARNASAATAALVPPSAIVLEYGGGVSVSQGVLLANGVGGAVWLMDGTTTIASAQYGGWYSQPSPGGRSIQLKTLSLVASGQQSSWCLASTPWATGADKGTPGQKSDCP